MAGSGSGSNSQAESGSELNHSETTALSGFQLWMRLYVRGLEKPFDFGNEEICLYGREAKLFTTVWADLQKFYSCVTVSLEFGFIILPLSL
jgi:hypothetical protein